MARQIADPGREQVTKDVLLALKSKGAMSEVAIRQVLKLACWLTSNRAGKRDKCSNWSEEAARRRETWGACIDWPQIHGLVHEHIVPRKWIENSLYDLRDPQVKDIEALLDLSEVCIVTECEDRKFGENKLKQTIPVGCVLPKDKWLRYERAGVKRYEGAHPASNFNSTRPPAAAGE